MEEVSNENRILIIIVSVILFILLLPAIPFDNSIMISINGATSHPIYTILNVLFIIETSFIHYIFVAMFFILLLVVAIAKDKAPVLEEWKIILMVSLIAFAFEEPLINLLKIIIGRPRPFDQWPLVLFLNQLTSASGYSFPSGHSASGFCVIAPLLLKFENRIYKILFSLFGYLTAFARVYVGVHFPTDIIVGSLVGIGLGLLSYIVFSKFLIDKVDDKLPYIVFAVTLSIYIAVTIVNSLIH
ncbi:MAG: phosphatase PAP2 family protein [Candidatus Helarchaeota archaeon]|nr:phosphatase PAP2 family protein [Candidatus Helarchaeota archaeon]